MTAIADWQSVWAGADSTLTAILQSGVFDPKYYSSQSGESGDTLHLIRHYLAFGERASYAPSKDFDIQFYRSLYRDVAASGASPLTHYALVGREQGRYTNPAALRRDVELIERSNLFDPKYFRIHNVVPPELSDIEYYLSVPSGKPSPSSGLDEQFYFDVHRDARVYSGSALIHFIKLGQSQGRVCTESELQRRKAAIAPYFNASYYVSRCTEAVEPGDALDHYVKHGAHQGLDPSPDFSSAYYMRRYPDLNRVTTPYLHYLEHGIKEDRVGRSRLSECLIEGRSPFRVGFPTIVIADVCDAKSATFVDGLAVARALAERYNVISCLGSMGPFYEDFLELSFAALMGTPSHLDAEYHLDDARRAFGVEAVLLNSIESEVWSSAAFAAGIPSVALLHESAPSHLPTGNLTHIVDCVDRIIAPSEIVRESAEHQLIHYSGTANQIVVQPADGPAPLRVSGQAFNATDRQMREFIGADDPRTKIVLGAGNLQRRDGVDLFVQTAAEVRRRYGGSVRFVWVGLHFDPRDIGHSVELARLLRMLDLEEVLRFFPDGMYLERMVSLADVIYVPGRLEPLPSFAHDAHRAGKPVVAFDGMAKWDGGSAVPYGDTSRAAEAIVAAFPAGEPQPDSPKRTKYQSFSPSLPFIAEQFAAAKVLRRKIEALTDDVLASGLFDADFHEGHLVGNRVEPRRVAARRYVARAMKGFAPLSPRPGFHEAAYQSKILGGDLQLPGLIHAASAGGANKAAPVTHSCVSLNDAKPGDFHGRVLIHIHLYYTDLAADFLRRLTVAGCQADLFITTTSTVKRIAIEMAFKDYKLGAVTVVEVVNRGRDVAPLLIHVRDHVKDNHYDLIGHFHGKRSPAIGDGLGDQWRNFLLDSLIGDQRTAKAILAMFEDDAKLGLVFAEDRHCVAWTKNRPIAETVAEKARVTVPLPDAPIFPIGTMFWTRPQALEPLWKADFESTYFEPEPLGYDGIIPGAIEMMFPTVCEASGYTWSTVYRKGISW